jgi:hypothetical protein
MNKSELKSFLDEKVLQYNTLDFIESDPVQIPHLFSQKEDIEIAGFLSATIAWGNRKMIIQNSHKMINLIGNSPYDFVMNHQDHHLEKLENLIGRKIDLVSKKSLKNPILISEINRFKIDLYAA